MVSQSPDMKITTETPIRAPSSVPVDDAVLPFEVDALDLRGRLTRLGPALDDILTKHDYPAPVGKLLGEAIVLATLLGTALKFDGRVIMQTQTDGAVTHSVAEDDAWVEGQSLIGTVEDVELIDPDLSGERLLYRLFHERGVRVFQPLPLRAQCSCSRDAVSSMLKSFAAKDRAEMVKDGKVVVTCEFWSSVYEFTPHEAGVEE